MADNGNPLGEFANLADRLANDARLTQAGAIGWAQPVPYFGDLAGARVAAVGLNPSDREFLEQDGTPIRGALRRFHTLESLGLRSWADADDGQIRAVKQACDGYFHKNPYREWFDKLDAIISGAGASCYGNARYAACHLDLVPYATKRKWSALKSAPKKYLLSIGAPVSERMIGDSRIEVLALNGRKAVDVFQDISQRCLEVRRMPSWDLRRKNGGHVRGYAYKGILDSLPATGALERRVLVLGFNHNIQSSFGITNKIRDSIRDWFAGEAAAFLR